MKGIIRVLILLAELFGAIASAGDNFTGPSIAAVRKAESSRDALSRYWFGRGMRNWAKPCPIIVTAGSAPSGQTSMKFDRGEVFGWRMNVSGKTAGEVETAVAHEVNHTVFASEFRRRLPRWLDEGAAQFVESESEHEKSRAGLRMNIKAKLFTPFRELFKGGGYQSGWRLANQYNEGFGIVEYLINHKAGGRKTFVEFVRDVKVDPDGSSTVAALRKHYGYKSADEFEKAWWNHWRARGGDRCDHFACKAPHGAMFDPAIAITDGRGNGLGLRSPIVGILGGGGAPPACRVVMFSGPFCGPCIAWKRSELGKMRAAGITVEIIENDARAKAARVESYPTFVFLHKGKETGRFVQTSTDFGAASKLVRLFGNCSTASTAPTPVLPDRDFDAILKEIARAGVDLRARVDALERKPEPSPTDLSGIKATLTTLATQLNGIKPADLSAIERRLGEIEAITIPIRIETSEGTVIRQREIKLERKGGRLVFTPIVLKFDEKLLRGNAPK